MLSREITTVTAEASRFCLASDGYPAAYARHDFALPSHDPNTKPGAVATMTMDYAPPPLTRSLRSKPYTPIHFIPHSGTRFRKDVHSCMCLCTAEVTPRHVHALAVCVRMHNMERNR